MPFWLADPTQGSTPSWLNNSTVILLAFISSVISIAQAMVSVARWAASLANKKKVHFRLSIVLVAASLASVVVIAPLTWTTLIRLDAQINDPSWVHPLYPIIVYGMVLSGITMVLLGNSVTRSENPWAWVQIVTGLGFGITLYNLADTPLWERYFVDFAPVVIFLSFLAAFLANYLTGKKKDGSQEVPA
jgi:hypothetical protein